jgi:hypothetical protein
LGAEAQAEESELVVNDTVPEALDAVMEVEFVGEEADSEEEEEEEEDLTEKSEEVSKD